MGFIAIVSFLTASGVFAWLFVSWLSHCKTTSNFSSLNKKPIIYSSFKQFKKAYGKHRWIKIKGLEDSLFSVDHKAEINGNLYSFSDGYFWLNLIDYIRTKSFIIEEMNNAEISTLSYEQYSNYKNHKHLT